VQHGPTSADVLLQLRHVSKEFGGQRVLADAELSLRPGAVHALVGQNGSGKSTLIKILAGYHHAERGGVAELDGEVIDLSHSAAARPWIRFIHQDLGLVPHLDTVDNLALGVGYATRGWIRYGAEVRRARARLRRLGVDLDVRLPVGRLSRAEQTMVAIARALGPTIRRPRGSLCSTNRRLP
jgi:ribose transport system ATP-binding protein